MEHVVVFALDLALLKSVGLVDGKRREGRGGCGGFMCVDVGRL